MVIYLKHPTHGSKVAVSEQEASLDKKNGWSVYDPTVKISKPGPKPSVKSSEIEETVLNTLGITEDK